MSTYKSTIADDLSQKAYPTKAAAHEAIKAAARAEGNHMVIDQSPEKMLRLLCQKHGVTGEYGSRRKASRSTGIRRTTTMSKDCNYCITIRRRKDHSTAADYEWFVDRASSNPYHSHTSSPASRGTYADRALSIEEEAHAIALAETLTTPARVILQSLRNLFPSTKAGIHEIYNIQSKVMEKLLAGNNPNEAIIARLRQLDDYEFEAMLDDYHRVKYLCFAPKTTLQMLARQNESSVFIADCTYKTNGFKMPLLNVVTITNMNTTMECFLCFLPGELEEHYTVAINWIESVCRKYEIPPPHAIGTDYEKAIMTAIANSAYFLNAFNFICIWHINQNILKKWKLQIGVGIPEADKQRLLAQQAFHREIATVWQSTTVTDFDKNWDAFCQQYRAAGHHILVDYVTRTWHPVRHRFGTAWSNEHRHFGNIATSRAEGAHAMLKKWISVSSGNLFSTTIKVMGAINAQYLAYLEARDVDRENCYWRHKNDPLMAKVVFRIPRHILYLVEAQQLQFKARAERIQRGEGAGHDSACTGVLMRTMGVPCSHIIARRVARGTDVERSLTVEDFSKQWWIGKGDVDEGEQRVIIDVDALAENGNDAIERERQRLIEMATARIGSSSLAQLTVVSNELQRPIQRIFNPAVVRGKGRPRGALARRIGPPASSDASTTRDPSHYELVVLNGVDNLPSRAPTPSPWDSPPSTAAATAAPSSTPRVCGKCKCPGHNARTCRADVIG